MFLPPQCPSSQPVRKTALQADHYLITVVCIFSCANPYDRSLIKRTVETNVGRTRKIADDAIIDAAERGGTIGLSIDAVKHEANIGKAHAVYNHRRKNTLLDMALVLQIAAEIERKPTFIEAATLLSFQNCSTASAAPSLRVKSGREFWRRRCSLRLRQRLAAAKNPSACRKRPSSDHGMSQAERCTDSVLKNLPDCISW